MDTSETGRPVVPDDELGLTLDTTAEAPRDDTASAGMPASVSGVYSGYGLIFSTADVTVEVTSQAGGIETAELADQPQAASVKLLEQMRLDVDGRYPQMAASGTCQVSSVQRLHWIARLSRTGDAAWSGAIWFKQPTGVYFPYTQVAIAVAGLTTSSRTAAVTFSAPGLPSVVRKYKYRSPYFRTVTFEFDSVEGIAPVTVVNTCAHPNRPASLRCEALSIEGIYNRAGYRVRRSGDSPIPIAGAGGDATWSDAEMHDAMQTYWSRFSSRAKWAMWVLFATRHDTGPSLGGIMFDDIGPNHRQGTAIFYDSFISEAPANDPNPAAFRARMRLWTAVHEMGHAFNLAHSWQKSLGAAWIPLADEPEARSFMNYPFRVAGGQTAFFATFDYRFSNSELLFVRHAPESFVRMGDAQWFDDHAFREAVVHPEPPLSLELRVNRPRPTFEFLEPVVIELKVKNVSTDPQIVDENVVNYLEGITLVTKRQGRPARQYASYGRYCSRPSPRVLAPGESIYGSVYVSAGLNGVDVAEPGNYVMQAALHRPDGDIVSPELRLRISPPVSREEEVIAQDYLTDTVGRVLAFDGSRVLTAAVDSLREVVDRLPKSRAARHARVALGVTLSEEHKVLSVADTVEVNVRPASRLEGARIVRAKADVERAEAALTTALTDDASLAAETLGHIDYTYYVDRLVDLLARGGERKQAAQILGKVEKTLSARGVIKRVLDRIGQRREKLAGAASPRPS